jgi:hypothetical protein
VFAKLLPATLNPAAQTVAMAFANELAKKKAKILLNNVDKYF